MAYKKYAYYNKGNKIALIEQSDSASSGFLAVAHCTLGGYTTKDTCEAAGGQWIPSSSSSMDTVGEYKSPVDTITNGLEIEYTYAPSYKINNASIWSYRGWANGWFVDGDGYVNLIRHNWDQDGSFPVTAGYIADSYIYIEGSEKLTGLHRIKSVGTEAYHGQVQLYTKYADLQRLILDSGNLEFDAADETIVKGSIEDFHQAGEYIVLTGNASLNSNNHGLFKISAATTNELTLSKQYQFSFVTPIGEVGGLVDATVHEKEVDATLASETIDCNMYVGYRDPLTYTSASLMEDESFELDLTRYQANAVVYYLQGKKFEDAGDLERHEYYMRKFRTQLEKASGSRKYGPHVVQGHWNMRK